MRGACVMPAGDQAVDDAWRATGLEDQIRPACRGVHYAVGIGGGLYSGGRRGAAGGSPCSAEDTPACRVIGAITIPADTSEVTSSALNGLAALAISALPGRR